MPLVVLTANNYLTIVFDPLLNNHSQKLEETTAELTRTSQALEVEKKKTDTLLYQMLPVKVANALRDGKKVDAGEI